MYIVPDHATCHNIIGSIYVLVHRTLYVHIVQYSYRQLPLTLQLVHACTYVLCHVSYLYIYLVKRSYFSLLSALPDRSVHLVGVFLPSILRGAADRRGQNFCMNTACMRHAPESQASPCRCGSGQAQAQQPGLQKSRLVRLLCFPSRCRDSEISMIRPM